MNLQNQFIAIDRIRYCYCCESLQVRLPGTQALETCIDQRDAKGYGSRGAKKGGAFELILCACSNSFYSQGSWRRILGGERSGDGGLARLPKIHHCSRWGRPASELLGG